MSGREEGRRQGEINQPSGYPGQTPLEKVRTSSPRSTTYTAASPRCPAGGARGVLGSMAKYFASTRNEQAGIYTVLERQWYQNSASKAQAGISQRGVRRERKGGREHTFVLAL